MFHLGHTLFKDHERLNRRGSKAWTLQSNIATLPHNSHVAMSHVLNLSVPQFLCFLKRYLFIFRERGREGERGGEKHLCVVASHVSPTGDLAHNPGHMP